MLWYPGLSLLIIWSTLCSLPLVPTTAGSTPQQQAPTLGGGLFGAQTTAAPATGGLFGAQAAPAGGGLFGNASAAAKPMFGSTAATPGQGFGATSGGGFSLGAQPAGVYNCFMHISCLTSVWIFMFYL